MIAAPGPSLPRADLARVWGHRDILAVTSAFLVVPHATHVYACDRLWWDTFGDEVRRMHAGARLWSYDDGRPKADDITYLPLDLTAKGLSDKPGTLHSGRNSGYQAIGLADQLGYSTALLVGFDMKPDGAGRQHFFGEYQRPELRKVSPYHDWVPLFRTIQSQTMRIVNCTPDSALDAFEFGNLEEFV